MAKPIDENEQAKQHVIAYLAFGVFVGIAGLGVALINGLPPLQCIGWFLAVSVGGTFFAGWLHQM